MNALLIAALFGVIMMFGSFLLKNNTVIRNLALTGILAVLAGNIMEMNGFVFFQINTTGMMAFSRFSLLFTSVLFACTFLYFLLYFSKNIYR